MSAGFRVIIYFHNYFSKPKLCTLFRSFHITYSIGFYDMIFKKYEPTAALEAESLERETHLTQHHDTHTPKALQGEQMHPGLVPMEVVVLVPLSVMDTL